jgi:alcohol dehydrogenase (cytochrome c)
MRKSWRLIALTLMVISSSWLAIAQAPAFEPVTDAMLLNPNPGDWINYRRTLDGWGYSPLNQLTPRNVNQIQLVWSWALAPGISEPTPLVYNGVMYIPNGGGSGVLAFDAATGDLLWEYRRQFEKPPAEFMLQDESRRRTRNLAIFGDKIYWATYDVHLLALDARTGTLVWDQMIADYKLGYRLTSGPIVVRGKIVSGLAGCDRYQNDTCFISAYDAQTGKQVWKTSTVARPGERGGDTWGNLPLTRRAGGDAWIPGSYDPRLNLIYWATSQAKPFTPFQRGTDGAALYTNSVLALDPDTGRIVWYRQLLPAETHDQDEVFENVLVDYQGRTSLFKVGKLGILWEIDRESGAFVASHDSGYQTLLDVDATGKVTYRPGMLPKPGEKVSFCGSQIGIKNWHAVAYHPETQAFYIPLYLHCSEITYLEGGIDQTVGGGGMGRMVNGATRPHPKSPDALGELLAMGVNGNVLWRHKTRTPLTSAVLTTGGGLVVVGDWDRNLYFHDIRTGQILFHTRLPNGVQGFPITYSVRGKQYVAVPMGTMDAAGRQSGPLLLTPEKRRPNLNTNGIFVFALPAGAASVAAER